MNTFGRCFLFTLGFTVATCVAGYVVNAWIGGGKGYFSLPVLLHAGKLEGLLCVGVSVVVAFVVAGFEKFLRGK